MFRLVVFTVLEIQNQDMFRMRINVCARNNNKASPVNIGAMTSSYIMWPEISTFDTCEEWEEKEQIASYYHYIKTKVSFDLTRISWRLQGAQDGPEAQFKH